MATVCVETVNWCAVVGDRIVKVVQFLSDGDPWDLTGATVESHVRNTWSSPTFVMEAQVTEIDAPQGIFMLEYDGEDARSLVQGDYSWEGVYDVQVTEAGQTRPETVRRGTFTLLPDATRG
jgi:hypothetical protein